MSASPGEAVRRSVTDPAAAARTLVILPTYNESGNIVSLCRQLLALEPAVDVLIVDDGSPDGTAGVAARLRDVHPARVLLEERQGKRGRGDAVLHGLQVARTMGYTYAIEMDADGSHDPTAIPRFLTAAATADLVIGSRHIPGGRAIGWNWQRRFLHWGAMTFARCCLRTPTSDHTNGYRCYRVAALADVPYRGVMVRGFASLPLGAYVFHRAGKRIGEVPVVFHNRRTGTSKMSWREAINGVREILAYRLWRYRQAE